MRKLNTLLMYQNCYEDQSWGCLAFHSEKGFDSIQEMVEAIAGVFNKVFIQEHPINSEHLWCCMKAHQKNQKFCGECGKQINLEISYRDVEQGFNDLAEGTFQTYGDLWEELQNIGIECGFSGNAGMTASIWYSSELIARTICSGFSLDNTETVKFCHTVSLFKQEPKAKRNKQK